jgi:16S rRNA processing protein RimM
MQLVVGRIAKAHGIGGEVSVEVRTDDPEHRFAVGERLQTDPSERGPLIVQGTRWHAGRLLIRFAGIDSRTAAESLRATVLVADSATSLPPVERDEYWDHDLIGLEAVDADGATIGRVTDVLHPPGSALLVLEGAGGRELLVPFVSEIVTSVDLGAGRAVVVPPEGLLEL